MPDQNSSLKTKHGGEKMAERKLKRAPKVLRAIIKEADLHRNKGMTWSGDTYPRYYKQGGIQAKEK